MAIGGASLEPGSVVAGKLRVIRVLGEGGMGAVFEVEHEYTKHHRALKLLHAEMTEIPGVVERFLREASAAGRIGSPHIVETFDAGRLDSGEPYIVMEMLDGRPLDGVIEDGGPLDPAEAVEVLKQACTGVQAAHDAGIIHRDLKPENLFLCAGERPFVKILDFGISKFDPSRTGDHQLTQEGSALGTPFYMSPEQVRGAADLDERADVYALGVVLYECLTAQKPYVAETLPHLAILIHEGSYRPVGELRPDVPAELAAVVHRAMTSDRDARFPTVTAMQDALEQVSTGAIPATAHTIIAPARPKAGGTAADGTPAALGRTQPATEEPSSRPAAPSAASTAATSTGDEPSEAPASRRGLLILVASLAVLGALAAAAVSLSGSTETADVTAEPKADLADSPAAPESDEPRVRPALPSGDPSPPPPPAPVAEPPKPPPPSAAPAPAPAPAPPPPRPSPTPASRAAKQGLAEENPF